MRRSSARPAFCSESEVTDWKCSGLYPDEEGCVDEGKEVGS